MAVSGDEAIVTRFAVSWDPMAACASSSARLPAGAQDVQEQGGVGKRDVVVNGEKMFSWMSMYCPHIRHRS